MIHPVIDATAPGSDSGAVASSPLHCDVAVVGAGFGGLAAALALHDAGVDVRVLEAAAHVGGRTAGGRTHDGQWLELGGQWVAAAHEAMLSLIERFGLRTESTDRAGSRVVIAGGTRSALLPGEQESIDLSAAQQADVDSAAADFGAIVESVDMISPWLTAGAAELDETTFAAWIRSALPDEASRRHFITRCEAIFAPDPRDVSLLHAAYYFGSGDHLAGFLGLDRDAQERRVTGGASVVCEAMADHLGARVHLRAAVRTVRTTKSGVELATRDGMRIHARRVIVSVPPPLAARIEYEPPLPSARDQLTQRMHTISVVKVYLVFERPFWREAGLSGEAVLDDGPVRVILDNTPEGYSGGLLVGFIEGADKRECGLDSPDVRRAAFTVAAVRAFGPAAADAVEYLERDWTMEEFARGCYAGHLAPGTWTAYGPALTAPIGPIHWAGTETSPEWTGYMEGAIRSGRAAAQEVLTVLTP